MNSEKDLTSRIDLPEGNAEKYWATHERIYRLRYNENDGDLIEKMARERRIETFMRNHLQIVEKMSDVVFDMVSVAKQNGLPSTALTLRLATSFQAQIQVQRDPNLCTPIDTLLENLRNSRKILDLEIKNQCSGRQAIGQVRLLLEAGTAVLERDQMSIDERNEIGQRWESAIDELNCILKTFEKSEDRK